MHHFKRNIFLVLAALVAGACPCAADEGAPLPDPMRRAPVLTSTFGEYRSGHYHGGLDYSTGGEPGEAVYAPADGWVFRVRCSGVGYGRAVYFRLDDGRTVLYAHLSGFHPRLESLVAAEQDRRQRYEIDHHPAPGLLAFRRGEILGYSGGSGAGPPHLHAEIRVGADAAVAVDPQDHGWRVTDTLAPRLLRLLVEPAAAGARVNGGSDPVILTLGARAPRLEITGPVRLWVETDDRADGGSYRLAPSRLELQLDGREIFLHRFHAFNWNWAREVEWTFHNARAREHRERWMALHPPPGSRQSMAEWTPGGESWWEDLSAGTHRLTIIALDAAGNRTEREVGLVCAEDLEANPVQWTTRVETAELISRGGFLEVRLPGATAGTVGLTDPSGKSADGQGLILPATGGWLWQVDAPRPAVPGLWRLYRQSEAAQTELGRAVWLSGPGRPAPGRGHGPVRVELPGLALRFPQGASYGPLWVTVTRQPAPAPPPEQSELTPLGEAVALGPWAMPLRERMQAFLSLPEGEGARGVALYSWNGRRWDYEDAERAGNALGATFRQLQTMALLRDLTPPTVSLSPAGPGRTPMLVASVQDGGAGVSWRTVDMFIDDKKLIAEWDPDARTLTGHLREPLDPGSHVWEVRASDRAGNTTVRQTPLLIN